MECKDLQEQLQRYIDGELPADRRSAADAHVAGCADCRRLVREEQDWQQTVRRAASYYTAPEPLRVRITGMARRAATSPAPAARRRGWAMAASLLLAVALSSAVTTYVATPSSTALIEQEVVASHVRSLQLNHIADVASSDQHTVKPWFHGKINYAPPVEDFAADGFPLIGGRLDYIARQPVAVLVYRHAEHPINVFVLPTGERNGALRASVDNGFNVLHWTRNGMSFWAVSDLNAAELADFEKLLQR
jgi:anti-sigma factor (TIGR02949 family)